MSSPHFEILRQHLQLLSQVRHLQWLPLPYPQLVIQDLQALPLQALPLRHQF